MVAITLAIVPLAKDLDPTQLLSIPTGLILFLVIWETLGSLERGARPVESWKDAGRVDAFADGSTGKDTARMDEERNTRLYIEKRCKE